MKMSKHNKLKGGALFVQILKKGLTTSLINNNDNNNNDNNNNNNNNNILVGSSAHQGDFQGGPTTDKTKAK